MENMLHQISVLVRTGTVAALLAFTITLATGMGRAIAQTTSESDALKSATQLANGIRKMTGAKAPKTPKTSPKTSLPAGDPCTVLSLADVHKFFPNARAGERSRRLEEYGITECAWNGPDNQMVLLVQEAYVNTNTTLKDDVRDLAEAVENPLKARSQSSMHNIRIETFPSLGNEAAAVVERADPKRGMLEDYASIELRRGPHTLSIESRDLPRRDRAAALKALEELGHVALKRLQ